MRRFTLVLSLALALFACAMFAGSVLSQASVEDRRVDAFRITSVGHLQNEPNGWGDQSNYDAWQNRETVSEEAEDPDMPKGRRSGIDEKTYLRLRDEYIARRRGMEPGRPFDPEARSRAIRQMQVQEAFQAETSKRLEDRK